MRSATVKGFVFQGETPLRNIYLEHQTPARTTEISPVRLARRTISFELDQDDFGV